MSGGVFGNAISTDIVSSDRDETAAIAGAIDCLLKADLRDFFVPPRVRRRVTFADAFNKRALSYLTFRTILILVNFAKPLDFIE